MSSANPEVRAFEGLTPACEAFKGGAEIDAVKVTAKKGKIPSVEFATSPEGSTIKSPLASIKAAQTKIVREGEGPAFTGDQLLTFEYSVFSSTTGDQLATSKWDGTDSASQVFNSTTDKKFCDALSGATEGSVVAFALPTPPSRRRRTPSQAPQTKTSVFG
jgi:hypothetical protein